MKGAKMRVEPKTIHTADVDAFAISYQHKGSLKVAKSAFHSNHIILTLLIVTFFLKSKLCKTQTEKKLTQPKMALKLRSRNAVNQDQAMKHEAESNITN